MSDDSKIHIWEIGEINMKKKFSLENILKQVTIIENSEIERIAIFNKYGTLRIYLKDGEVLDARII